MHPVAESFIEQVLKLAGGERFDLYDASVSSDLERIAGWLFGQARPYNWYDGVRDLIAQRRKTLQVDFSGEMWVAEIGSTNQWLEAFWARVTDQRCTKQGIWISMRVGDYQAEGDLEME